MQKIIILLFCILTKAYGQQDTLGWQSKLLTSEFISITRSSDIDQTILTQIPQLKEMANVKGKFSATDIDEGAPTRRLFFAANSDNKWIISYEHGGIGYHTHCLFISINNDNTINIKETYRIFTSLKQLKKFAAKQQIKIRTDIDNVHPEY